MHAARERTAAGVAAQTEADVKLAEEDVRRTMPCDTAAVPPAGVLPLSSVAAAAERREECALDAAVVALVSVVQVLKPHSSRHAGAAPRVDAHTAAAAPRMPPVLLPPASSLSPPPLR
jgi:hypothetical protein